MKLLLDTHALLWYTLNDPQLSVAAQAAILDPANDVYVSPATYWELAIKISIGKYVLHRTVRNLHGSGHPAKRLSHPAH